MATRKSNPGDGAGGSAESVRTIYDAWKLAENKRTELVLGGVPFTSAQWLQLQTDVDAMRDAYYFAMSRFVDSSEGAIADLKQQIKAVQAELKRLKAKRENLLGILGLVDKLAGLAGKLLAIAAV